MPLKLIGDILVPNLGEKKKTNHMVDKFKMVSTHSTSAFLLCDLLIFQFVYRSFQGLATVLTSLDRAGPNLKPNYQLPDRELV